MFLAGENACFFILILFVKGNKPAFDGMNGNGENESVPIRLKNFRGQS